MRSIIGKFILQCPVGPVGLQRSMDALPESLLLRIFGFESCPHQLLSIASTCKRWMHIVGYDVEAIRSAACFKKSMNSLSEILSSGISADPNFEGRSFADADNAFRDLEKILSGVLWRLDTSALCEPCIENPSPEIVFHSPLTALTKRWNSDIEAEIVVADLNDWLAKKTVVEEEKPTTGVYRVTSRRQRSRCTQHQSTFPASNHSFWKQHYMKIFGEEDSPDEDSLRNSPDCMSWCSKYVHRWRLHQVTRVWIAGLAFSKYEPCSGCTDVFEALLPTSLLYSYLHTEADNRIDNFPWLNDIVTVSETAVSVCDVLCRRTSSILIDDGLYWRMIVHHFGLVMKDSFEKLCTIRPSNLSVQQSLATIVCALRFSFSYREWCLRCQIGDVWKWHGVASDLQQTAEQRIARRLIYSLQHIQQLSVLSAVGCRSHRCSDTCLFPCANSTFSCPPISFFGALNNLEAIPVDENSHQAQEVLKAVSRFWERSDACDGGIASHIDQLASLIATALCDDGFRLERSPSCSYMNRWYKHPATPATAQEDLFSCTERMIQLISAICRKHVQYTICKDHPPFLADLFHTHLVPDHAIVSAVLVAACARCWIHVESFPAEDEGSVLLRIIDMNAIEHAGDTSVVTGEIVQSLRDFLTVDSGPFNVATVEQKYPSIVQGAQRRFHSSPTCWNLLDRQRGLDFGDHDYLGDMVRGWMQELEKQRRDKVFGYRHLVSSMEGASDSNILEYDASRMLEFPILDIPGEAFLAASPIPFTALSRFSPDDDEGASTNSPPEERPFHVGDVVCSDVLGVPSALYIVLHRQLLPDNRSFQLSRYQYYVLPSVYHSTLALSIMSGGDLAYPGAGHARLVESPRVGIYFCGAICHRSGTDVVRIRYIPVDGAEQL